MEERETTPSHPSLPGSLQKSSPLTPITNVASGKHPGIKISLTIDSISNASVDVIVNSSNKQLQLQRGAISKFILNAAGPQIQAECNQKYPRGISTSTIAITKGYNLKCKNVFHLALRFWNEGSPDSNLANLTQIITTCLQTAEKMGAKSLAFPILGSGKLRYPIEELPRTMYEAVKNYSPLDSSQIKDVYFVVCPTDTEIIKLFTEYLNGEKNEGSHSKETRLSSPNLPGLQQKTSRMTSITNVKSIKNGGIKINLMIGSISSASVDVIVNSANKQLQLQRGAISKFILNAAGPQIQDECNQKYPQGISTSTIAVTKGYNLICKNVFHLALPHWNEDSSDSNLVNLTQIITTCLQTAEKMGSKSLAFPILGAGTLRYPIEELPRTMYEAVKNYSLLNPSQIKDVNFVVYPTDTHIEKKFKEYFQEISANGSAASSEAAPNFQLNKSRKNKFRHRKTKAELIPDTWSPMEDDELFQIVPVTHGPEYDDIQTTFRQNLPSSRIIKIERIQNKTLYHGYQVLKKKFEVENPGITNEVQGLWHGTAAKSVNGINKSGFNRSYCGKNATAFGEGVYFARDIKYSANDTYSTPDSGGIKRIYKCSVLVGRVMRGSHGLKYLQDSNNSAVDNIHNPSIYVIFHDSQAYPNYLITFSNH